MTSTNEQKPDSLRLAPDVLTAKVGDDLVLLNSATGNYHLLNATGRLLLDDLTGEEGSVESAVRIISSKTGEALDNVRADAEAFLDSLIERELITRGK